MKVKKANDCCRSNDPGLRVTPVRIATRGSELALAQAGAIAERISRELDRPSEMVVITTTGDRIQDVSLAKIGGKGLFIKEIEQAILDDRADVAVHSAKDLPAALAPGLVLASFPERADPRDALVVRGSARTVSELPSGARVGTGSTRRMAQLLSVRPDLELVPMRGNVPTRLSKLESESLDALILACAGLDRLGLSAQISERISTDLMLPAVAQGTLALQTRQDDPLITDLRRLEDPKVSLTTRAERSFLEELGGDCTIPLAGFCETLGEDLLRFRGWLSSANGETVACAEQEGPSADPEAMGTSHDGQVLKASIVQERSNGAYAAIHHVGRCDEISTCLSMRQGGRRHSRYRRIVHDGPTLDHPTMPMIRVLAKTHIRHHTQVRTRRLEGSDRTLDNPIGRVRTASTLVFGRRNSEEKDRRNPEIRDSLRLLNDPINRKAINTRHR